MGLTRFVGGLRAQNRTAGNGPVGSMSQLVAPAGRTARAGALRLAPILPALAALAISLVASAANAQPTLTTSPNPSIHNQSVRLQAVISDVTAPTGTMTFRETGVVAPLGSAAVATARYTKVVAGGSNMCGIVSDTTLECWGYNAVGQLGDGTISGGASTPVQVAGLIGVTNIEIGNDHICAVLSDKTVKCWGNNVYGQVGNTTGGQILSPTTVTGLTDVTAVALGTSFSCALKSDATVVCWGRNNLGQLGIGNTTDTNTPTPISGLTNVTAITAGQDSACALKSDGTVSCWGSNQYRQLGDGNSANSSSPRSVLNLSTAVTIDAGGGYQVCALLADATIQCWGRNDYGQLGTGTAGADQSTPQTVSGITNATSVGSGNGWSCAALAAGNPQCWGFNYYGALAQGFRDGINTARPTPLDAAPFAGAVYFAMGGGGSCAILANDTITCVGENFRGQLGNGRSGIDEISVTATNVVKTFTKSVAVITHAFAAGNHTLTADFTPTVGVTTTSANVLQTVNKLTQTITFPALTDTEFSATQPVPNASASSGLAVSYDSTTGTVCTVTTGGTISFVSVGTCSIRASQAGDASRDAATPVTQSFNITQGANSITFPALANTAFTATPPTPGASASSNLTVAYSTTTAPVCTVTNGGTISFVSAGTCSITASQAGNTNFVAATAVTQSFTVTPGANTIVFPALANTAFTSAPPTPGASASSNLTVAYSTKTAPVCTVTGDGTISFVSAGTCSITASQAGNTNFAAATDVTQSFTVTPGVNTITFPALANTAFTSAPPTPGASASSNLTVAYSTTTAPVCTVSTGGTISFVSAGTCSITASQAGSANFAVATAVTQSFTVTPGVNTITFPALANTAFTSPAPIPAAVASSNLTVTYASITAPVCTVTNAGAISFVAAGTCSIRASQPGNANFAAATDATQSFNVTPGVNTITFPALANTAFTGTPPIPAAVASSNLTVTYASTTVPVCTATGAGAITFVKTGTCTITASQAGNANFAAATVVTRSFNVTPGTNTITFPALANTAFTGTPPVPAATASSNLTVTYASTTAPVCTATATGTITFVSAGTCSITASQAGDTNFAAATAVTRSFNVTPGGNTITFPALANTAFSATPPVPAATSSSNLTVTYASTTAPVCTVTNAGVITFVSAGTCTITASQAGDASFAAATPVSRSFTVLATVTVVTTSSLTPAAYGVPVTFTATATVPAGGPPTGTVTFKDGATTIGAAALTNGVATLTTATLDVGAHSITAAYEGSQTQAPAVSPALIQTVTKAVLTAALTVSPNPVPVGNVVTLQAVLTATPQPSTAPTGSIVFKDGQTVIGTGTLLAGSATLTTSTLPAGGHSLTADYAGDANFAAATSAATPLTVERSCNDIFSGAPAFTEATGSASGSTVAATGEIGEGNHGGDTGTVNSVWCKWTAPVAGLVTLDTTGSTFDTALAVYTGASLGQLNQVAANDNIDPATSQSRVSFQAEQGTTYLIAIDGAGDATGDYLLTWNQAPTTPSLYASVLPTSRSVLIGSPASAFATIINAGPAPATQCAIALPPGFPGTLTFQTTTTSNDPAGVENVPADIQPGQAQSYVFAITPTKGLNASEVALSFTCANAEPAPSVPGLSRLTLSASNAPTADILAIISTLSNDGIVDVPLPGKGLYAAAAINIGAASDITASVDDGGTNLPLTVTLCQSDPSTGACADGSQPEATKRLALASGGIVTFTVFVEATAPVPFNPGVNRLHLRLKTNDNVTRGSASLAVRTQQQGTALKGATGTSALAVGNGY